MDSSSESEEVLESDDDEIEVMLADASDSEQEKWASRLRTGDFIARGV